MFDNSAYYGLKNPGFTTDIGYGMIDMMYPATGVNTVSGTIDPEFADAARLLNNGQPANDTYQNQQSEETNHNNKKSLIIKSLIGLAVIGAGAFGFYKFKTPIMNGLSKIAAPVKNFVTNMINKFKKPSP